MSDAKLYKLRDKATGHYYSKSSNGVVRLREDNPTGSFINSERVEFLSRLFANAEIVECEEAPDDQ